MTKRFASVSPRIAKGRNNGDRSGGSLTGDILTDVPSTFAAQKTLPYGASMYAMHALVESRLYGLNLKVDQFRAGQVHGKFRVSQSVLQIAPSHARMLPGENLGAHAFAIRDRIHNPQVLVG